MHQKPVIGAVGQDIPQRGQDRGGDIGQVLPRLHDVQIDIGHDAEQRQNLIQHLPVLAGDADMHLQAGGGLQGLDDRRHLDGFRPGPKNDQNFHKSVLMEASNTNLDSDVP